MGRWVGTAVSATTVIVSGLGGRGSGIGGSLVDIGSSITKQITS